MDVILTRQSNITLRWTLSAVAIAIFAAALLWQHLTTPVLFVAEISTVQRRDFTPAISARVLLIPDRTSIVVARAAGTVTEVLKKSGDEVKSGEVIALLKNPEITREHEDAEAEYAIELEKREQARLLIAEESARRQSSLMRAKLQLDEARLKLDGEITLNRKGVTSSLQLRQTENAVKLAEAELEQATLLVRAHEKLARVSINVHDRSVEVADRKRRESSQRLQQLLITSEFDGRVTSIDAVTGQAVSPGTEIAQLISEKLIAECAFVEADAALVAIGDRMTAASVGTRIDGVIERISPTSSGGILHAYARITKTTGPELRANSVLNGQLVGQAIPDATVLTPPPDHLSVGANDVLLLDPTTMRLQVRRIDVASVTSAAALVKGLRLGDQVIKNAPLSTEERIALVNDSEKGRVEIVSSEPSN